RRRAADAAVRAGDQRHLLAEPPAPFAHQGMLVGDGRLHEPCPFSGRARTAAHDGRSPLPTVARSPAPRKRCATAQRAVNGACSRGSWGSRGRVAGGARPLEERPWDARRAVSRRSAVWYSARAWRPIVPAPATRRTSAAVTGEA